MQRTVQVWEEEVMIPTYEIGTPEQNPMFLENRVYQGSSGVVYPLPVIESISDEKKDKSWKAIFLENEYLKIMVLPQLGGRIQMAFDKIKQRYFIYYNEVIKPALVGLNGPWISGGIEFNWPQHHRPSTYSPVEYQIENNEDGSKTVWCSEVDRMYGTKGMAGFTLYPDKAYLEVKAKLYNRTSLPQSFLWWANPAVHVNDYYQSVFPPDVNAVFDHGRRDVSTFPIAHGTYYKVDYSAGVDISRYKNIPVPTSYMAVNSKYDFVGCYEHDTQGGMIHVANRHISPGKKQWTWGNSEFGYAWDRNLTDSNGPYAEIMCGVYTDNQPDFAWLMPYEEKTFSQYFMAYHDLGVVKNASKDALLNLEFIRNEITLQILTLAEFPNTSINIYHQEKLLYTSIEDCSPHQACKFSIPIEEAIIPHEIYAVVKDEKGKILIDWRPEKDSPRPIPAPADPAQQVGDITSMEELYLTGLHLEQYRHATYRPEDYYLEGLRREPRNASCNRAMGLFCLRKGMLKEAVQYLQMAVTTLTQRNPNPIDGEAFFYLAQALELQEKYDQAFEFYYKATWNAYYMDSGYFHLARIACRRGSWDEALDLVNRCLHRNWNHHKARHLKVFILIQLKRNANAIELIEESLALDPFNSGLFFDRTKISGNDQYLDRLHQLLKGNIHSYITIALDYAAFGSYKDAIMWLDMGINFQPNAVYPMALYFKAWFAAQIGQEVVEILNEAKVANPAFCFPNQVEEMLALENAININPHDSQAFYYLGNYHYHHRQHDQAIRYWEKSIVLSPEFSTCHRNLALGYYNISKDPQKALYHMDKAFHLNEQYARNLLELDQLHKKLNSSFTDRLNRLNKYPDQVQQRDDLYLEKIALLNLRGDHATALDLIAQRNFHPWEGGEGSVSTQYTASLVGLARYAILAERPQESIQLLEKALTYPHNLGEGKLYNAQDNDIYYWLGVASAHLGEQDKALKFWNLGSQGIMVPAIPWFYNDQQPDKIFYKGLSLLKLNQPQEAMNVFQELIDFGEQHKDDLIKMDYFAVSFPEMQVWDADLQRKNKVHCLYMQGLGHLGSGNIDKASTLFQSVLSLENSHLGGTIHLQIIDDWLTEILN